MSSWRLTSSSFGQSDHHPYGNGRSYDRGGPDHDGARSPLLGGRNSHARGLRRRDSARMRRLRSRGSNRLLWSGLCLGWRRRDILILLAKLPPSEPCDWGEALCENAEWLSISQQKSSLGLSGN